MVDKGLALAKPDYALKSVEFLNRGADDNAAEFGRSIMRSSNSRPTQAWVLEQKLDAVLDSRRGRSDSPSRERWLLSHGRRNVLMCRGSRRLTLATDLQVDPLHLL